jgi:hypothetical protein
VRALLAGPTRAEARDRYVTALPARTMALNGLTVAPDTAIATVALLDSGETAPISTALANELSDWQLAQVVDTLTSLQGITEVALSVNGQDVDFVPPAAGGGRVRGPFPRSLIGLPPYLIQPAAPRCHDVRPPAGAPMLTLDVPARVASRGLQVAGSTTAVDGGLAVELLQDRAVLARDDRFAQPLVTGGQAVPCPTFVGTVQIPFGVSGPVVVRLALTPGPSGGEPHEVRRTVLVRPPSARQ